MASVKINVLLNGINTVTSILFPIITFPYAARVLLPEGIGVINFQLSVINYIVLLTSLGIPLYAVKEIARFRDNQIDRDKATFEIILLSVLLCLVGYVGVWLLADFVPQIHQQSALFYILSLTILFNAIGVNWFYQGIEDFKFITYRAIIIRTLSALSLFIFVHSTSDLLIYGVICVGSTVGNNAINFVHLRKYLHFSHFSIKKLNIIRHIRPACQVFVLNLIISLYIQLNSIMLGFMAGDDAVGYFAAGTKISHIGLILISSLGTVMLPRCSHLIETGKFEQFANTIKKSARFIVALSLPMIAGLMILATPITLIFCGKDFIDSIPILYLNAPVIILIGLTNVMGIQILYPMGKVNIVICSVSCGAIVNILLNLFLIPIYSAVGAAIATLFSELAVYVVQIIAGKKYYPFSWDSIFKTRYFIATLMMSICIYVECCLISDTLLQVIVSIFSGMAIYGVALYAFNDDLVNEALKFISNLINRK